MLGVTEVGGTTGSWASTATGGRAGVLRGRASAQATVGSVCAKRHSASSIPFPHRTVLIVVQHELNPATLNVDTLDYEAGIR